MTNDDKIALVTKWQQEECVISRNRLVHQYKDLVHKLAYKNERVFGTLDDLVNEGYLGVIKACNTFDVEKHTYSFDTHVYNNVKWTIWAYIKVDHTIPITGKSDGNYNLSYETKPNSHEEIVKLSEKRNISYKAVLRFATSGGVSNSTVSDEDNFEGDYHALTGVDHSNPENIIERQQNLSRLVEAVRCLKKDTQKMILKEKYLNNKNRDSLSKKLGCSKQNISMILNAAYKNIRKNM